MTLTHKIAKHTTVQIVGRFIGFMLSLISIVFLTRYLGTDGFGKYITIVVFVNMVAVFAGFGLDQILIKEYFKTKRKKYLIANTLALRAIGSLLIFIIGAIIGHFLPYAPIIKIGICVYSLSSFLVAVELIFLDIFQINLRMHHQVIAETVNRIITLLLIIASIYLNLGLAFILLSTATGSAIQILIAYFWVNKIVTIKLRFNFKMWRNLLIKAIPLGISAVLIFIYYKVDTIILSLMKPSADVGIYGAAYKVLDIVSTFPGMFCGLLLPVFANVFTKNKMPHFNKLIQKGFDVLAITGIPITIILFSLARPIILLVAGNQFTSSVLALQILAPSAALIYLNWIFWIALVGGDKQNNLILPYLLITIFNVILNLILIPRYSYLGAASTTIATQLIALFIPWWLTKKFFKTSLSLVIPAKAIVAGVVMFFVFYLIQKFNLFINWQGMENINTFYRLIALTIIVLFGSAIYLGVLGITGALKKSMIKKVMG